MGGVLVLLWLAVIGRVGGLPPIVKIGWREDGGVEGDGGRWMRKVGR